MFEIGPQNKSKGLLVSVVTNDVEKLLKAFENITADQDDPGKLHLSEWKHFLKIYWQKVLSDINVDSVIFLYFVQFQQCSSKIDDFLFIFLTRHFAMFLKFSICCPISEFFLLKWVNTWWKTCFCEPSLIFVIGLVQREFTGSSAVSYTHLTLPTILLV